MKKFTDRHRIDKEEYLDIFRKQYNQNKKMFKEQAVETYFAYVINNPEASDKERQLELVNIEQHKGKIMNYYYLSDVQYDKKLPTLIRKKFRKIIVELPMTNGWGMHCIEGVFAVCGIVVNRLEYKTRKKEGLNGVYDVSKCELLIPEDIKIEDL